MEEKEFLNTHELAKHLDIKEKIVDAWKKSGSGNKLLNRALRTLPMDPIPIQQHKRRA